MHICIAAKILRPGTDWNYHSGTDDKGNVVERLEQALDGSPRVTVPSMDELKAVMDQDRFKENRLREYPLLNDQLDAIWKGGAALDAMRATVMGIKAKYPKPE